MKSRRAQDARAGRTRPGGSPAAAVDPVPPALLQMLKRRGPRTIRELAQDLDITYEAVRQQMADLARAGWVTAGRAGEKRSSKADAARGSDDAAGSKPGPASRQYRLSTAAEHLFPKHYDELAADLVQHVRECFGGAGVVAILARMTEARVRHWAPLLQGLTFKEKLKALSALYEDKDAYMQVEWREGAPALIEHNCPFFNVAHKHPAICSVSVNTLERLLGCKVVREERFQAGHGRCVFRVRLDEPHSEDAAFTLER